MKCDIFVIMSTTMNTIVNPEDGGKSIKKSMKMVPRVSQGLEELGGSRCQLGLLPLYTGHNIALTSCHNQGHQKVWETGSRS